MTTRYSFGGDEHIFVEVSEEMSLEAFFKSLSMTNAVRDSKIKGVTEICPANASSRASVDGSLQCASSSTINSGRSAETRRQCAISASIVRALRCAAASLGGSAHLGVRRCEQVRQQ